jgi:ABC-type branched-subunit amino acid transport system ATPase component
LARDIDAEDAPRVADDVMILNTGRIVYDGPAEDARNQPELLRARLGRY